MVHCFLGHHPSGVCVIRSKMWEGRERSVEEGKKTTGELIKVLRSVGREWSTAAENKDNVPVTHIRVFFNNSRRYIIIIISSSSSSSTFISYISYYI